MLVHIQTLFGTPEQWFVTFECDGEIIPFAFLYLRPIGRMLEEVSRDRPGIEVFITID